VLRKCLAGIAQDLKTARRRREVTERHIGLLAKYNMPGAIRVLFFFAV
jgi:hypothetical protein